MAKEYQELGRPYSARNLKNVFGLPSDTRIVQAPDAQGRMIAWYDFGRGKELVRIKSIEESVAELEHCL